MGFSSNCVVCGGRGGGRYVCLYVHGYGVCVCMCVCGTCVLCDAAVTGTRLAITACYHDNLTFTGATCKNPQTRSSLSLQ